MIFIGFDSPYFLKQKHRSSRWSRDTAACRVLLYGVKCYKRPHADGWCRCWHV